MRRRRGKGMARAAGPRAAGTVGPDRRGDVSTPAVAVGVAARAARVRGCSHARVRDAREQDRRRSSPRMARTGPRGGRDRVTRRACNACRGGWAAVRRVGIRGRPGIPCVAVARPAGATAVAEVHLPVDVEAGGGDEAGSRLICLAMAARARAGWVIRRRRAVAVAASHGRAVGPCRSRTSTARPRVAGRRTRLRLRIEGS